MENFSCHLYILSQSKIVNETDNVFGKVSLERNDVTMLLRRRINDVLFFEQKRSLFRQVDHLIS